jgi:hypothetical protein
LGEAGEATNLSFHVECRSRRFTHERDFAVDLHADSLWG